MNRPHSRLLLTGATGFIGQHLHRFLLDRGHAVRVLLRPASAAAATAAAARLDPRCEVQIGELTDPVVMARALSGVRAVVYAAGSVRGRCYEDFLAANVTGIETLVQALEGADCQVLLISSLAAERPELSDYARSKRAGEEALRRADWLSWSILRPPAVYGPGDVEMRPLLNLVRTGLAVCPGPSDQRLALLHVDDLVRAVDACLSHPAACRHRCFTLDDGTSGGYDWTEIGQAVAGRTVRQVRVPGWLLTALGHGNLLAARLLRYAPMLTPGKARELQQASWLCDNRALTLATGWQPEIDLAAGARLL